MLSPVNIVFTHEDALGVGASFIGPWRDLHNFSGVSVLICGSESVASARLEWSNDASAVRYTTALVSGVAPSSLTGGAASQALPPLARYVRLVVVNGGVAQPPADFLIQVVLLSGDPGQLATGSGGTGGLTNAELRASPVPVTFSGEVEVKNDSGNPLAVSGTVAVSNFPTTQPVSGTVAVSNFPASVEVSNDSGNPLPVSGTVGISGTVPVSGPLTDTQLRATPVPVSGTVTVTDGSGPLTVDGTVSVSGSVAVTGPLTDTQLRASSVPVSGPLTDTQLRATPVPVSGTVSTGGLTDTQLRATPVPISGTVTVTDGSGPLTVDGTVAISGSVAVTGSLTDTQLRATSVPVSGPLTDTQLRATPVPVSGTVTTGGLTDTQLRATPVPISGTVVTGGLTDTQLRTTPVPVSGTVTVNQPVTTKELNQLVPTAYDFLDLNYTGDDITTVIYKTGGAGGTTVATLTLVYSAPGVLDTVTRT